jgi:hypothetical protein
VSELQELLAGRVNELSRRLDSLERGFGELIGALFQQREHIDGRIDRMRSDFDGFWPVVVEQLTAIAEAAGYVPDPPGGGEALPVVTINNEQIADGEGRVAEESEGFEEAAA